MSQFIIIDGYNFLHAVGMLPPHRKLTPQKLEQARAQLYDFLKSRLSLSERGKISLVFDVRRNRGGVPEKQLIAGMAVYSAVNDVDADTLIERLVEEHRSPKNLLVVTDDRRLAWSAKSHGASTVDCESYYQYLLSLNKMSDRPNRKGKSTVKPVPLPKKYGRPRTVLPEPFPDVVPEELSYWEERVRELDEEEDQ